MGGVTRTRTVSDSRVPDWVVVFKHAAREKDLEDRKPWSSRVENLTRIKRREAASCGQ